MEFANEKKLFAGDTIGSVGEMQLCRIQIWETILSHIKREKRLFSKGVKALSLFFIDEVAKYEQYGANGVAIGGEYAEIFEEEYNSIVENLLIDSPEHSKYINNAQASSTHAGYFSIDKRAG